MTDPKMPDREDVKLARVEEGNLTEAQVWVGDRLVYAGSKIISEGTKNYINAAVSRRIDEAEKRGAVKALESIAMFADGMRATFNPGEGEEVATRETADSIAAEARAIAARVKSGEEL